MEKTKCAPALWRKFTPEQRVWWTQFYNAFKKSINFPTGFDGNDREIIAHNLASRAIWELNGDVVRIEK